MGKLQLLDEAGCGFLFGNLVVIRLDGIFSFHNPDKFIVLQDRDFRHVLSSEDFHGSFQIVFDIQVDVRDSQVLGDNERVDNFFLQDRCLQLIERQAAHIIAIRIYNLKAVMFPAYGLVDDIPGMLCVQENVIILIDEIFHGKGPEDVHFPSFLENDASPLELHGVDGFLVESDGHERCYDRGQQEVSGGCVR